MQNVKEKIAYIQGLAKGLNLSEKSDEGRVLESILDVLGDICDRQNELEAYTESLEEDLEDIENFFDALLEEDMDFADEDEDDDLYEVICPECGHTYLADFEDFETDSVTCPKCSAPFHLSEDVVEKLTHKEGEDHE